MLNTPTITFTPGEVSTYYAVRVPYLKQRRAAEWRGACPIHHGKNDNFAVEPATGRWFCHSTCGRGGDILTLEQELTGLDFRAAKTQVFGLLGRVDPEGTTPRQERRRLAGQRAEGDQTARDVLYWRWARIAELEWRKAAAAEAGDIAALAESSTELYRLETDGVAMVKLYRAHLQRDAEGAAELVRRGQQDERDAQTLAAALVLILARAEGPHAEE